jgi:DNA repair exonuclease SbcCD ATPase subunit
MFMQSRTFRAAMLAALMLGLAACASQKEPAEAALAAAEAKFTEMGADIQKYLPERYAEVEQQLAALRDSVARQEYGDVVAGAAAAQDEIKRAVADARIKRAQLLVEMESEWNDMVKSMPAMIAAMDKKVSAQRGRPPQGMTADAWKQTVADYDAARDAWSKAAAEMTSQTFEATVVAARDAKAKIVAIMESLGVKAS